MYSTMVSVLLDSKVLHGDRAVSRARPTPQEPMLSVLLSLVHLSRPIYMSPAHYSVPHISSPCLWIGIHLACALYLSHSICHSQDMSDSICYSCHPCLRTTLSLSHVMTLSLNHPTARSEECTICVTCLMTQSYV